MNAALPIDAYMPHRGTMRLIHRLIEADDDRAVAEIDVPLDGPFVRDGAVPAWIGIEYMAQAISAWAGARALRAGGPPRLGFLLGSRRYASRCNAFAGGTTLRIEVRCELMGDNGLGQFDCTISQAGETLASARLSVFEPAPGAALP